MTSLTSLPHELLDIIVGMVLENLDSGQKRSTIMELLSVSKQMREAAQPHLFRNKAITFKGNGEGRAKGKGFNDWCTTVSRYHINAGSESRLGTVTATDRLSSIFRSIRYEWSERSESPQPDSGKYVCAFTSVKGLELSCLDFENLRFIPDFATHLGPNIRTLTLRSCTMEANQLVSYLRGFDRLKRLEIDVLELLERVPSVNNKQPLPSSEFSRLVLSLSGVQQPQPLIETLGGITTMRYTRIILDYAGKKPQESAFNSFLHGSKDTLTHLRIHSEPTLHRIWCLSIWRLTKIRSPGSWGPFDASQLTQLMSVVIDSLDFSLIIPMIQQLTFPPATKELVLVVNPQAFVGFYGWDDFDQSLTMMLSLGLPHRNGDSPLHFYITNFDYVTDFSREGFMEDRLPLFTSAAFDNVLVDGGLAHGLRV